MLHLARMLVLCASQHGASTLKPVFSRCQEQTSGLLRMKVMEESAMIYRISGNFCCKYIFVVAINHEILYTKLFLHE